VNLKYKIVRATNLHLAAIPAIESAAAAIFPEADLPLDVRYKVTDAETLRNAQQDGQIWIATDPQEQPVGFAMITVMDGNPHLDEMDVLPAHGRNGIGTRLALTVIDWAASHGHDLLTLVTFRHLPWNAAFYTRLGFETVAACNVGQELRDVLEDERIAGINMNNRVVMMKKLR
jgi:GNAT superfamily N-acetyltransferase